MEACVVVCRKKKPRPRRHKVLFIDAKDKVTRKNAESWLEQEHIEEIVAAYNNYVNIDGFASVVDLETIKSNSSMLSISLYVTKQKSVYCILLPQ